ncbi:hypothetical protein Sste5346_006723 [Sporothrix stenoceras]|uniref:Uncharacterized protein n=1 Tax=Sporothrix stenoceras TaxID=5173 RepID=A0ABR3YYD3_9PEZI
MARLRISSRRSATATATALAVLYLASSAAAAANRTCYFPDGSESPSDFPCSDADTIHCCNSQNACLSTGYCISAEQQPYVISRGSCTDNAWGTGCPAKCAGTNDDPSGGLPISWTGSSNNAGSPLYCCGPLTVDNGSIACANGETAFVLGTSEIMFGVAILQNTTQTNGTSAAASSSVPASSASASSPSTPQSSGSSSGSSGSSSGDSSSKSNSNVTAVGAGVGVSLGVVAAAFATWALYERRKRHQQLQAFMNGTLPPGMSMAHPLQQGPGGPDGAGGAVGAYPDGTYPDGQGMNNLRSGNPGTPFSPAGTTTGTITSNSPSNAGGVYAASNNGNKPYADSQQPLVELSAYPRQFEELPASDEHR